MPKQEEIPNAPEKDAGENGDELRVIGISRRRVDARAKVTGQTRFADDISLPRMAHCKLLRSPHPHARIRKIDVSRALAHPGVYLVLTGKDLPI
jgi:CO/xanthine dehydrogenase Mo-binding subunit